MNTFRIMNCNTATSLLIYLPRAVKVVNYTYN